MMELAPNESPVKSIDCTGQLCPMPIYKTSLALRQVRVGEVLRVVCTDPGSLKDFPALARDGGHELLAIESEEDQHIFYLRKGAP